MAKKQLYGVGLLPSGRAVRFKKMNTTIMLDMSTRAAKGLAPGRDGEIDRIALGDKVQREQIAITWVGITLEKVSPILKAKAQPQDPDEYDLDAMLVPLRDNPSDPRWTQLNEEMLINAAGEFHMLDLLDEPSDWKALLNLMSQASGGGLGANPFAGKVLMTSSG